MSTLTLPSPAKLNLFLHILKQRADGYHDLQTLFQILDYGDELTFEPLASENIEIQPALEDCKPEDNLIWKAAKLLQNAREGISGEKKPNKGKQYKGVSISVTKRIPVGGGIGGGSSNAATTLLGLNHLWNLGLSIDELAHLSLELGADVPIFVRGESAWAEGIGEIIKPVELKPAWFVVITPSCSISTAKIFQHEQLTRSSSPIKIRAFLAGGTRNDCESLVRKLYPEIDKAINDLSQFGDAKLTGTGACIFATFDNEQDARLALANMQKLKTHQNTIPQATKTPEQESQEQYYQGFVAKACQRSPLHERLEQET